MVHLTAAEMIHALRASSVPPVKLDAHKAHPTCCKGWRIGGVHSDYCFANRDYYVMLAHPATVDAMWNTAAENSDGV